MTTTFYPQLRSLVPVDALPDELGFVKDGLANLLDDLYFKDLQFSRNARGDAANYSLSLVSRKRLEVEIPGTGIFLMLNPGHSDVPGSISEFPITLAYEWGILSWFREFDLSTFSFSPTDLYQLALTVLGISERQLIDRALAVLVASPTPIQQFVTDINAFYGTAIAQPTGADPIGEILAAIRAEPGLEDSAVVIFSLYLLDQTDISRTEAKLEEFFSSLLGGSVRAYLQRLLIPKVEATLGLGVGLKFPRSVLVPLTAIGGDPLPDPAQSLLIFDAGDFFFSTERGIGYDQTLAATLTPSRIGNSGFEIEVSTAKLDISRKTNIPEADADGRGADFVGVWIERATIKLPAFFNQDETASSAALVGRNLLIGTGGLSGTLGLEAIDLNDPTPALIRGRFGSGFELGLSAVQVSFQQNAITGSQISGFMKIPGFKDTEGNDAEIQIVASIGTDGEFSVTASEEQGLQALSIPDVLDLTLTSLSVGSKEDRFFVALAGAIKFQEQGGVIGNFIPEKIQIDKLLVWEDGKIEFEGGGLTLPQAVSLKIGPAELSITAVHFGSHEQEHNQELRQYYFFGFDGGLSLSPGGVDARGDGIKFYFTNDNGPGKPLHVFLRIQALAIELILPGNAKPEEAALLLKGFLAMKDAPGATEYQGGVEFSLPKLKLAGSAAMRYNPRLPSFLVDLGLELATPIVLGATGLGIYGFRGLVGMRYVATKAAAGLTEDAEWWRYYKAKIAPDFKEGIQVSKFAAEEGFSLGAGVSLATVPDAGRAFSSKLFFLLSLPDVFLLQGQGQILKKRIGLDTTQDPPFFALIAITSTSLEAAFGVNYNIPDGGEIAKINGLLEMGFFWQNSAAWYINIGKDQPEDRRVSARLFTLFNSYFYLMLSSGGIRAGAGVTYELKKKIGPFRVDLGAFLDVSGRVSFEPRQIGGAIALGGHLGLTLFGVGFHLSASASLTAEAPRPFVVSGKLEACVKVLWSRRCVKINLTWTFNDSLNLAELEILSADLPSAIRAVHMLTRESFGLFAQKTTALPAPSALANFIIPVDSFIDLEFKQGVKPTGPHPSLVKFAEISGAPEYTLLVAPQKAKSSQVRHEFRVESLEILSFNPTTSSWQPYDIYAAATPLQVAPFVTTDLSLLPYGYWQKTHPQLHNKLRVLSQTPFSYFRQGSFPPPPEDLGLSDHEIFCPPEPTPKRCLDFTAFLDSEETRREIAVDRWYALVDILYQLHGNPGEVHRTGEPKEQLAELCFDHETTLTLLFPAPMACVVLDLHTSADGVTITYYGRVPAKNPHGNAPVHAWEAWKTVTVPADRLVEPVVYDDRERPVLRVDIRGDKCRTDKAITCDLRATVEAEALLRFLDRLVQKEHLLKPEVLLYPEFAGAYTEVFLKSPLYQLADGTKLVRCQAILEKGSPHLFLRLQDDRGYDCVIRLSPQSDKEFVDFASIQAFLAIEPDPSMATSGVNYDFTVLTQIRGEKVTLRGRSCYPIHECHAGCRTCLREICTLSLEDAIHNDDLPTQEDVEDAADVLVSGLSGSIQPIWRPDTHYALKVVTSDAVYRHDDNQLQTTYTNTYTFGWRTVGPLGHFHKFPGPGGTQTLPAYAALEAADREDEFRLATLQHFLDLPKCFPNADGRLTLAKPLFYRAPRLDLFYRDAYVYEMFRDWDAFGGSPKVFSSLEVEIKDPAAEASEPPLPPTPGEWVETDLVILQPDILVLNNMIENGDPCVDVDPATPISVETVFPLPDLLPSKLYTAIFQAKYRRASDSQASVREVHRYVFQTSRYPDFAAQIDSSVLERDGDGNVVRRAVYELPVEVDAAALSAAAAVLADPATSSDELKQRFADPFDRLIDGIFQLGALPPAATTEFNIVRQRATGRVLGILVRSPEPFNDPKMPAAELQQTLGLTLGSTPNLCRGLFAKDGAQVFMTNSDHRLELLPGALLFTFSFRRFNGSSYVPVATAAANFFLP